MDFNYEQKQRVVALTENHKIKRVQHCEKYADNNLDFIAFSDESYFKEFNYSDYCWKQKGTSVDIKLQQKDKFGSIMIFGIISK